MVMVVLPLREELFASRAVPAILRALSEGTKPKIPKATFHRVVRSLQKADIVGKNLSLQVRVHEDRMVVNLRDSQFAQILSSKFMAAILEKLVSAHSHGHSYGIRELASMLECSPGTVKPILDKLQAAGLLESGRISADAIHHPDDPLEEVPRIVHRKALKYFLSFLGDERHLDALVMYGDAAIGKPVRDIEVLAVRKLIEPMPSLASIDNVDGALAIRLSQAAHQVSVAYPPIHLNIAIVGTFHWQSYRLVSKPFLSSRLYRASQGIVVYGDASANLAKLFEDWRMMAPMSPDDLERAVARGYATKTKDGYEATMKWVNEYIAPATTKAGEDEITVTVNSDEVTISRIVLVKGKET